MKRSVIIIGMSLMLMASGNGLITAQRGMGGMSDTTRMGMKRGMPGMQMHAMRQNADSAQMCEAMKDMGRMHMRGEGMMPMNAGMRHMRNPGMMRMHNPGMRPMEGRGMRNTDNAGMRQMGPGMMMLESIPNVTEKQKKEITDLRLKQQAEMQKLREESAAKMKAMRETHSKNMMNILTDEQKKFLESKRVKAETPPATTK